MAPYCICSAMALIEVDGEASAARGRFSVAMVAGEVVTVEGGVRFSKAPESDRSSDGRRFVFQAPKICK